MSPVVWQRSDPADSWGWRTEPRASLALWLRRRFLDSAAAPQEKPRASASEIINTKNVCWFHCFCHMVQNNTREERPENAFCSGSPLPVVAAALTPCGAGHVQPTVPQPTGRCFKTPSRRGAIKKYMHIFVTDLPTIEMLGRNRSL